VGRRPTASWLWHTIGAVVARALAVWLLLLVAAFANGALRESFLTPRLGAPAAHVLSTTLLCLVILTLALVTISWIAPFTTIDAITVGLLWLVLVLAFEFGFGHFAGGKTWTELLADYNVARGRVWIAVPIVTAVAPYLAARIRGLL
jgi:hypothetical protein